jgi:hypothetical protein
MDFDGMVNAINAILESRVEYETQHKDSGDNYAYLVTESWCSDDESRLIEYMRDVGIDWAGLEIDDVVNECLERFRMESGHMFSSGNGGFLIASFPVGDIECQIDCDTIGQAFTPEMCALLSRASAGFFRYRCESMALAYVATDSVWDAVVPESRLRRIVAELKAKKVYA